MSNEGATSSSSSTPKPNVKVKSGAWGKDMPGGLTVAQYREKMNVFASVPKDAVAMSGTTQLGENDIVEPGASLEFIKKTGEKG